MLFFVIFFYFLLVYYIVWRHDNFFHGQSLLNEGWFSCRRKPGQVNHPGLYNWIFVSLYKKKND